MLAGPATQIPSSSYDDGFPFKKFGRVIFSKAQVKELLILRRKAELHKVFYEKPVGVGLKFTRYELIIPQLAGQMPYLALAGWKESTGLYLAPIQPTIIPVSISFLFSFPFDSPLLGVSIFFSIIPM